MDEVELELSESLSDPELDESESESEPDSELESELLELPEACQMMKPKNIKLL